MKHLRLVLLSAGLCAGLFGMAWQRGWIDPVRPLRQASPSEPTVLFVVLDTVRADHLGVCGYHRPNTPNLQRLVDAGASITCTAYAPGSWTLPSHASYFTGREVPEHGAHHLDDGIAIGLVSSKHVQPLGDAPPTVAEQLGEQGYQGFLVSGNPVLAEASGLQRGFDGARVSPGFGYHYGNDLLEEVRSVLRWDVALDRPLFLMVNIADAHHPWSGVPAELGWIPERPPLVLTFSDPEGPWSRYLRGAMPEQEADPFLAHLTDVYDYGIYRADATFGALLKVVDEFGWASDAMRIVIVSDHGEHLGEQGLLDHGASLYEPNQRVPLLVSGPDAPVLPSGPVSATGAHELVLGEPLAARPVRAVGLPDRVRSGWAGGKAFGSMWVASWEGPEKWLAEADQVERFDLATDPGEGDGEPQEALPAPLQAYRQATLKSVSSASGDVDLMEALKAAGYVE